MKRKLYTALILGLLCILPTRAQDFAIKSNLLYDATATANLGIEFGVAPKWTLDISGNLNSWEVKEGSTWKHWMVQPEARYWFCDRFSRSFLGLHALGGQFNFGGLDNGINFLGTDLSKLSDHRYQGNAYGVGIAYGYAVILGKHWNLEFELGVGYIYADWERFECAGCGRRVGEGDHHYFGPTKAAINLVYLF